MDNPKSETASPGSARAQLRENLATYFEVGDLESLCFDLGVDYDGLPGDGKAAKVVELIEYLGRSGRIVELIDRCAQQRPNVGWADLRAVAVATPALFQPVSPAASAGASGQLLNLPSDRALKLGIGVGALVVVLLLCGFSGGLLAGRFVSVTLNPVPVEHSVGNAAQNELSALQTLSPGRLAQLTYNNIKATSLANELLVTPDSPISEVHVQFLDGGDVALNARLKALGNRRVVVGFSVRTENGRMVLTPKAATLDLLKLESTSTTFGWVPIPIGMVGSLFNWLQQQLDLAARNFWFERVVVGQGQMQVVLRKR